MNYERRRSLSSTSSETITIIIGTGHHFEMFLYLWYNQQQKLSAYVASFCQAEAY